MLNLIPKMKNQLVSLNFKSLLKFKIMLLFLEISVVELIIYFIKLI